MAVTATLMPDVNEVPADFPATVLWRFRLAALGTQLLLWGVIGGLFGALTERRAAIRPRPASPGHDLPATTRSGISGQ
jgi:predicted cobalt transporter CbtA